MIQVTSLDAFWSPQVHIVLWQCHGAFLSSQYSSISSETLQNGHCFGAQQPSNLFIKKSFNKNF